jgi:hypothetical protein
MPGATVAKACNRAKRTHSSDVSYRGTAVATSTARGDTMLMFNRSQLYLGLALAGLFQIIVRVVVH